MVLDEQIRILIISACVLLLGIIHLGVGIGIVAQYRQFGDVFQQQIGLCGYNIFIAIFTIAVGIVGIIVIVRNYTFMTKIMAIVVLILGLCTLASLITALALSGNAATYLRNSINNNMNNYVSNQNSINIINNLQITYQCCGANVWLDWARVPLGLGGDINIGGRRRRSSPSLSPSSPLVRSLKRRQNTGTIWNLPTSYTVKLPLSCCTNGGTTNGNSLAGYCVFSSANSTSSFFVGGCLQPVSNIAFSQIAGVIVINTCLVILSFVYCGKLATIFLREEEEKSSDANNKHLDEYSAYQIPSQPPQYPHDSYSMNDYNPDPNSHHNYDPSLQYNYNNPGYRVYL